MLFFTKVYYSLFKKNNIFVLRIALAIFVATLLLIFLPSFQFKPNFNTPPKAVAGKLELSDWNFQKDGTINLDGHWEFYEGKLFIPDDFKTLSAVCKKDIVSVPSPWSQYKLNGRHLSDEGCATYRLLIELDHIPQNIAIKTRAFISSCKIWVDDEELFKAGVVGDNANDSSGCFNPQIVSIHPKTKKFYITIQVSNFGYAGGGFVTSIELGDVNMLFNDKNKQSYIDIFLFGSIFIMGLYHLTLYMLRKKDKSTLYFGIICLLIAIRVLLMGEMLLYSFMPSMPLYVFLAASMLTIYLGLTFFVMFIHTVFPVNTPMWFLRFSQAIGIIFSLLAIFTSDKFNNAFLLPYELTALFILIIILLILIKAILDKKESSFLVLIAVLSIILFTVNDIMNSYGSITTGYYIPLGLFLFIFVQSFMLSRKFARAFFHEEQLLKSEIRMLQAQIKPHFLFNSINTIISVCGVSSEKAQELLMNLSNYLRCSFSFKNDDEFIDFETELLHVASYLAIEKERFLGKLNIVFDVDSNIHCKIPPFILQPIVENAVKHGVLPRRKGGTIKLTATQKNNLLTVIVEDDGIGMSEEKLRSLIKGSDKITGIGVSNVRNRLERLYGKQLKIKSIQGKGTVVTLTIPVILKAVI